MDITNNKRSDTFSVENVHPEEYHMDDGRPVFHERHKNRLEKKVTYSTTHCPECGAVCHNDDKGRASCAAGCGGFIDRYLTVTDELSEMRLHG